MIKRKRLFIDIETSFNIASLWRTGYKLNVDYNNIISERSIICISYKWANEKKVHSLRWNKKQCDKKMLQEIMKVINEADEIVYHNGDRFDLPFIRTRCLFHGIPVNPSFVTIDTLKFARNRFAFNSNRLDYIAKFLGVGAKIKTNFGMWKAIVLKNDQVQLEKMVRYCNGDVKILEFVFNKMNPYLPAKTHIGKKKRDCPECGSVNTVINNRRKSAAGVVKVQIRCNDCGKFHSVPEREVSK